jgi:Rod binding domain-containing protein
MNIDFDIIKKSNLKAVDNSNGKAFSTKDKEKLKNAAYEFQAMLIGQMLKSMRNTEIKDENPEDSYGSDMYTELFDMQLAKNMSRTGRFGIAEMLYKKLTGEDLPKQPIITKPNLGNENGMILNQQPKKSQEINPIDNSTIIHSKLAQFNEIINDASKKFKVEPSLIKAIITAESGGNKLATSRSDAKGLMQLMDDTAREMGVTDSFNPSQNINGGARYISEMLGKYNGDLNLALAAYNAGPGAVDKFDGVPPFKETQNYIKSVTKYLNMFKLKEQELTSNE